MLSKMCGTVLAYPRTIGYTLQDGSSLWVSPVPVIHTCPLPDVSKGSGKCLQRMSLRGKNSPNNVLASLRPSALNYIYRFFLSFLASVVNFTYLNAYPLGSFTKHLNSLTSCSVSLTLYIKTKTSYRSFVSGNFTYFLASEVSSSGLSIPSKYYNNCLLEFSSCPHSSSG